MTKVITYGTYDLLHYGHIRLLERAKKLGDYLIVGVTADDFDKSRGKINVQQSLMERIEAVRATGLADEIIIEEYEGQKIDDICKYHVDIFTVGSDWTGYFDYLNAYCKVVYLERTEAVSSTEIRKTQYMVNLGLLGDAPFLNKVLAESRLVDGLNVSMACSGSSELLARMNLAASDYKTMLEKVDAVYIRSRPTEHYQHIRMALDAGCHVLCEAPVTLSRNETAELLALAEQKGLVLMEAVKTAYATAYARLLLLAKGGKIGDVVSVDAACTSLQRDLSDWNGFFEWAPTALLPILQLLGVNYRDMRMIVRKSDDGNAFAKIELLYDHAVASVKVGNGVKSEGELIISGTEGYCFVPAPWWKTDYFEIRYENQSLNKRYFYQLDGEGIRYELVAFLRAIQTGGTVGGIDKATSLAISEIMQAYHQEKFLRI